MHQTGANHSDVGKLNRFVIRRLKAQTYNKPNLDRLKSIPVYEVIIKLQVEVVFILLVCCQSKLKWWKYSYVDKIDLSRTDAKLFTSYGHFRLSANTTN